MGNECLCWRRPRSSIHAPFFVPRHAAYGKPSPFEHSASKNPPPFKHLPPSTRGIPSFPHESHLGIVPTSPLPPYKHPPPFIHSRPSTAGIPSRPLEFQWGIVPTMKAAPLDAPALKAPPATTPLEGPYVPVLKAPPLRRPREDS